jgi:uncharacterized protein (DUF983 family)
MSLFSILSAKCPRCHESKLFSSTNPYKKGFEMNKTCSNCNLKYEKEPSFFYGAMYISYSLNIAFFVIFVVAYYVLFEDYISGGIYISGYVLLTIIFLPLIYRLSRSIWIHIFVDYEPEKRD